MSTTGYCASCGGGGSGAGNQTTDLYLGPMTLNLSGIRSGDRNARVVKISSSDGTPWNLTGATIRAQARAKETEPDPPALEAEITMLDPLAGAFVLAWPGDDVAALLAGAATWAGVWDLQVQAEDEPLPATLVAGTIQCAADVTR